MNRRIKTSTVRMGGKETYIAELIMYRKGIWVSVFQGLHLLRDPKQWSIGPIPSDWRETEEGGE